MSIFFVCDKHRAIVLCCGFFLIGGTPISFSQPTEPPKQERPSDGKRPSDKDIDRIVAFFKRATPAQKLAIVEYSDFVEADDRRVKEYEDLFKLLTTAYKQGEAEISALTCDTVFELRRDGLRASPREVMEVFTFFCNRDGTPRPERRDYAMDAKGYRILRKPDKTHTIGAMLFVDYLRLSKEFAVDNQPSAPKPTTPQAKPDPQAETMLKMGQGLEKAKKKDAALGYYRKVVEQFPGTTQAKAAEERVKALTGKR